MRTATFIFLFFLLAVLTYPHPAVAQSEPNNRLVLIEESSADNCGPCYTASNTIRNVLTSMGTDKVVMIRYGAWSSDDYYINNPLDNSQRVAYYGNTTVPKVWVDGQQEMVGTVQIANNLANFINDRSSIYSPLDLHCTLDSVNESVSVTIRVLSDVSAGNYYLRIAVVEEHYVWKNPPGTNGQTIFDFSLLDMVPSAAGTRVQLKAGDTLSYVYEYNSTAVGFHDRLHLAAIAFVQNDLTKEILQAVFTKPISQLGIQDENDFKQNKKIQLSNNYPNPFNPSTVISYQLSVNSLVSLKIYNTLGQEVRTLVNARQNAGRHTVQWDAKDHYGKQVGSGVYFYRLTAGEFSETKKMILSR